MSDAAEEELLPAWALRREDTAALPVPRDWPHRVDREWAWGGSDGAGVRVAIVDSGIDPDHELVGGNVTRSVAVVRDEDGQPRVFEEDAADVAGHGTACAGLIRALAPACELWSVRVLGPGSKGGAVPLLGGLRWAVEQGAQVINLSLSTPKRETAAFLHEIADNAYFSRSVLVASAHNMDVRSYPWRFASVISVATHDGEDPLEFHYNPKPPVEFFSRGMDVEVAWLGGSKIIAAGNSFATANMAGICALILGKHPELTPFQLKTVLHETATNVGGA
jgi:subtilisin family serine protease